MNFAVTKSGAVVCPIPYELLVRCFPALAGVPMKGGKVDADELRGMKLEYAINRHRGGRRSLSIFWPRTAAADAGADAANGASAGDNAAI